MSAAYSTAEPLDDDAWRGVRRHWPLDETTAFLNHGSFGLQPFEVQARRRELSERLARQPIDFYLDQYEPLLHEARDRVAEYVGAGRGDLVLVDNATYGMNVVAASLPLRAGDEVLLTGHEYGAVRRLWRQRCLRSGAEQRTVEIPLPVSDPEQVAAAVIAACTPRTRLIVISHLTSGTALWLPVERIVAEARMRGIRVAIDGPHAVGTTDLRLAALDCDYYTASCHKWLCAPLGSGFLYVAPRHQAEVRPLVTGWGRIQPAVPENWQDEFTWRGTLDPAPLLAIPAAIDFFERLGRQAARRRMHALARYARRRAIERAGCLPISPDDPGWYGPMCTLELPESALRGLPGGEIERQCLALRDRLRADGIIVPILPIAGRPHVRFSCHVYTLQEEIDRLIEVLRGGA